MKRKRWTLLHATQLADTAVDAIIKVKAGRASLPGGNAGYSGTRFHSCYSFILIICRSFSVASLLKEVGGCYRSQGLALKFTYVDWLTVIVHDPHNWDVVSLLIA